MPRPALKARICARSQRKEARFSAEQQKQVPKVEIFMQRGRKNPVQSSSESEHPQIKRKMKGRIVESSSESEHVKRKRKMKGRRLESSSKSEHVERKAGEFNQALKVSMWNERGR